MKAPLEGSLPARLLLITQAVQFSNVTGRKSSVLFLPSLPSRTICLLPPLLTGSEVGVFRLDEFILLNKNYGKNGVAFEAAEKFSTEICFVALCYFKGM